MSHVTQISDVLVTDLDALEDALEECPGTIFRPNQKTFGWYGKWMNDYRATEAAVEQGVDPKTFGKCDHAISVDGGSYEIGLQKTPDGKAFRLLYDSWGSEGRTIETACGKGLVKLRAEYNAAAAARSARRQGHQVTIRRNADTSIDLDIVVRKRRS